MFRLVASVAFAFGILSAASAQADNRYYNHFDNEFFRAPVPGTPVETAPTDVDLQEVIEIANDRNSDIAYLNLMIEQDSSFRGLYLETEDKATSPTTYHRSIYSANAVTSPDGALLVSEQGRDVIMLRGTFNITTGIGEGTIRYLKNGLLNSFGSCKIKLARDANQIWRLYNSYTGAVVTNAKVITSSLGVKTITGICPK